jgi:hypothetical protein
MLFGDVFRSVIACLARLWHASCGFSPLRIVSRYARSQTSRHLDGTIVDFFRSATALPRTDRNIEDKKEHPDDVLP